MSVTRILSEIAVDTATLQAGKSAVEACRNPILDTVGVVIAGHKVPGIGGVAEQVRRCEIPQVQMY